ncbi:L-2-amino-thiazoline-4-carboxylic acid hydrolase [Nocardia callitridis]|uniref:L-2-amino-thiazoline-4-carboxylic acid hydrolase n=1 Tax=Nocardia callitridis TaxID=648753 RepID=A0ABP9KZR8_9NOCA
MTTGQFDSAADGSAIRPDNGMDAVVDGIFEHLAANLHGLPHDFTVAMRTRLEQLEKVNADRIVDEPARSNLRVTLAVVVGYRAILPKLGRAAAIAALRAAFVEPLNDFVREHILRTLDEAEDPFATMVAASKDREQNDFGSGFTFDRPIDDNSRYHLNVTSCFYHDVLVAHSVPELAPIMCEFDTNWIDAIDPDTHGFRFSRTTTIGYGGTHCPFHFERT